MAHSRKSGSGQTSVTYRPRWRVIGRILLRQSAVFQMLLLPPLAAAAIDGETRLAVALGIPALLAAAPLPLLRRIALPGDIRRIEAVLTVVMVFLISVLLTSPAYVMLGLAPLDALFEATSALTTTGFSMIATPEGLPTSAHVLRAWSQWCGGLVIAVAGLAFLMGRGPASRALGFADFGDEPLESSTGRHARALLLAYLAITLTGAVGAAFLVPGLLEGPLLALTAVSTGGMTPRGDSLASYSAAAQGFLILLCMAGAISLAVPVLMHRHGIAGTVRSSGLASVLKAFLIAVVATVLLHIMSGVRAPAEIWRGVVTLLSAQTTTGFTVGPVYGPAPVAVLLLVVMAIGGQTGSTAGGLKIERVRVLLSTITLTLRRLQSPGKAVLYQRLDGEIISGERLGFAVALALTYVAAALLLWTAFLLHGLTPLDSLFDVVSALSTVGAGTGVIGPDLPPDLKPLVIFAMLLGRVEFFGLLVLAHPGTWKRRT